MNLSHAAYNLISGFDRTWAIQPERAEAILALYMANPQAFSMGRSGGSGYPEPPEGIALIPIEGVMSRSGMPCMESASTVDIRVALRSALKDPSIKAIVMPIDSPGGTVAGTGDLGDEIAAASKVKPVYAYVPDMACSAAFWAASQSKEIWASENATQIGNIGVRAAIVDSSQAAEAAGIKVHVVASGAYKALGAEGVPVPEVHIEEVRRIVADQAENFIQTVAKGRGVTAEKAREWADGRWFTAHEALQMGLIDKTGSIEDLYQAISSRTTGIGRSMSSPAGRSAASAPPSKPMSILSAYQKAAAYFRGNPEAAQAAELTPEALASLEVAPQAAQAPQAPVIPVEFEERIKAAEAQAGAYRESIALGMARTFSAEMVRDRRIQPEGRSDAEAMFLDAARIDGGGAIALNERGELIEGDAVTRVRRSYASRQQHQHGDDVIPNGDPNATSADKGLTSDRRTRYLSMTATGRAILAREGKN